MEQEELLNTFKSHLDVYRKHREYIRRAQAQAEKFSSAVIEKVVLDHEIKASEVADELLPLVPEIEGAISGIDEEVSQIAENKSKSDEEMEEKQLRLAIGELTEEGFEAESADLRADLDKANARLETLTEEREELDSTLAAWVELAAEGGQDDGTTPSEAITGEHVQATAIQEDVSAVFHEPAQVEVPAEDAEEAIEAAPAVDFGFEEESSVDEPAEEEPEADEIGIDLDVAEEPESQAPEESSEEPAEDRRALLLYQEGTAEEQIYPFHGEVLTVGRGRDNDIQIKNDSKVSRFHCKLFRRGGNFYIEDNKSSNGSLVNGELITERRLFGGEEIIIGETFFRFRIM